MSLLRRAASRQPEQRVYAPASSAGDPWAIPSNGSLAAYTPAGVPITEDTAMQLLAVAACVRILSEAVAGLPLDAVRMQGTVRRPLDPAPLIIADPFGGQNNSAMNGRRTGIGQMMVSLLLRGNAYCQVLARNSLQLPVRLRVLHPDRVRCRWDPAGSGMKVYKINKTVVPSQDIVHIMGMSFPEAATGMSVISYARSAIALGLAAEEFGARFFGSGAHMSGVIKVAGDLTPEKARELKETFSSSHAGLQNSHAVGVLTGGADWTPISINPEDAQFLATRQFQVSEVAMLMGVPPHMIGQTDRTTSWGTGIEQQSLGFLRYTLESWTGRFEEAWTPLLPRPQVARFNYGGLLKTDTLNRYTIYQAARNAAIMTPDEIRALEDMPPLPDGKGQDAFAPLNSAHTTDPGWQPGQPEAAPGETPPADPTKEP